MFLSELLFVPCCRLEILLFGRLLSHFWLLKLVSTFVLLWPHKVALLRLVTARRYSVRYPCHDHRHHHCHHYLCDSGHHCSTFSISFKLLQLVTALPQNILINNHRYEKFYTFQSGNALKCHPSQMQFWGRGEIRRKPNRVEKNIVK